MPETPEVSTCANPNCNAPFLRLGEGRLLVFSIDDPSAWGLPENAKQKAVWLCAQCSASMYVHLDRRHRVVRIIRKVGRAPEAA